MRHIAEPHEGRVTEPLLRRALEICSWLPVESGLEDSVRTALGSLLLDQGRLLHALDVLDEGASPESEALRNDVAAAVDVQLASFPLDVWAQLQQLRSSVAELQGMLQDDLAQDTAKRVSESAVNGAAEVFVLALIVLDMLYARWAHSHSEDCTSQFYFPVQGSLAAFRNALEKAGFGVGEFRFEGCLNVEPKRVKDALVRAGWATVDKKGLWRSGQQANKGELFELPVTEEVVLEPSVGNPQCVCVGEAARFAGPHGGRRQDRDQERRLLQFGLEGPKGA